jgi:hypothetical protein
MEASPVSIHSAMRRLRKMTAESGAEAFFIRREATEQQSCPFQDVHGFSRASID